MTVMHTATLCYLQTTLPNSTTPVSTYALSETHINLLTSTSTFFAHLNKSRPATLKFQTQPSNLTIPTIQIALPSPATFDVLLEWIYTHDDAAVWDGIVEDGEESTDMMRRVDGIVKNAETLGMCMEFWAVLMGVTVGVGGLGGEFAAALKKGMKVLGWPVWFVDGVRDGVLVAEMERIRVEEGVVIGETDLKKTGGATKGCNGDYPTKEAPAKCAQTLSHELMKIPAAGQDVNTTQSKITKMQKLRNGLRKLVVKEEVELVATAMLVRDDDGRVLGGCVHVY
ncbi:hypothetical protein HDV00_009496 [Rhizophlyctis rosea]|nr:hypothetical protein HDV00_009496 [Rhizophlyctis rosea]